MLGQKWPMQSGEGYRQERDTYCALWQVPGWAAQSSALSPASSRHGVASVSGRPGLHFPYCYTKLSPVWTPAFVNGEITIDLQSCSESYFWFIDSTNTYWVPTICQLCSDFFPESSIIASFRHEIYHTDKYEHLLLWKEFCSRITSINEPTRWVK